MLYDKLKKYAKSGVYPMHMPGHKRNSDFMPPALPCEIDITEIHGFDDLRDPQGVLLETSRLAASLYKSREAFLLINGSSVGLLAAIGALTKRGDKILATTNCHISIPNAAGLFGPELVYITPELDKESGVPCSIKPEAVESALNDEPEIKLVIITSPTYEGVVSDIESIAEIAHNAGTPLLVDGAHGAHLGFSAFFPESAVNTGADIVVMSLHKTLPALTQCSLLHICSDRVNPDEVKRLLSILQTSSPSYVLMASIDHCLRLLKSDGDKLFHEYERNLTRFYESVKNLKHLKTPPSGFFAFDPGKIVVITKNTPLSGSDLADILRNEFIIEIERVYNDYIVAMTSICDHPEGFSRLADALNTIDARI
jgi:arginine/lysine/ornithine decarboxylase